MLVLSRREGESIRIGDDIELVVTSIQGNRVKLGVRAPRHIPVHRKELLDQLDEAAELRSPSTPSLPNSSCLLYTSPSPRDVVPSRMPSSA